MVVNRLKTSVLYIINKHFLRYYFVYFNFSRGKVPQCLGAENCILLHVTLYHRLYDLRIVMSWKNKLFNFFKLIPDIFGSIFFCSSFYLRNWMKFSTACSLWAF